jgi:hypothetical protein
MIKHLFLLIILFSSVSVFAQVDTVKIIENSDEQRTILLKSGNNTDQIQELKLIYSDQGYFDARIKFDSTVYAVQTGEHYKLHELRFIDEKSGSISDEDVESIDYSKELVEQRIKRFYNELIDDGYRNAELSITEFEIDSINKAVSIQVLVRKNDPITVSRIVFTGNRINSQSVANTVIDHQVNSGRGIKMAQQVLNNRFGKTLAVDGVMGPNTLRALNSVNAEIFVNEYNNAREQYYISINNPTFINGWLIRLKQFAYSDAFAISSGFIVIAIIAGIIIYKNHS